MERREDGSKIFKDSLGIDIKVGQMVQVFNEEDGYGNSIGRTATIAEVEPKSLLVKFHQGQGSIRGSRRYGSSYMIVIDGLKQSNPELFL